MSEDDLAWVKADAEECLLGLLETNQHEEFHGFVDGCMVAVRAADASKLPTPSFIVRGTQVKSDEQKSLRRHMKRLLFAAGGASQISSGVSGGRLKGIAWLKTTPLKLAMKRKVSCPACVGVGTLTLDGPDDLYFACACGHSDVYGTDAAPDQYQFATLPPICHCSFCSKESSDFIKFLRNAFVSGQSLVVASLDEWKERIRTANAQCQLSVPGDEKMRRDYALRKNDVGKSLRRILSMAPSDGEEFVLFAAQSVESDFSTKAKKLQSLNQLVTSAKRNGLLYEYVTHPEFDAKTVDDAFVRATYLLLQLDRDNPAQGAGSVPFRFSTEEWSRRVYELLIHGPDNEEVQPVLRIYDSCVTITVGGYACPVFTLNPSTGCILGTELVSHSQAAYYLNHHFLWQALEPAIGNTSPGRGAPLFNSITEGRAYERLIAENPRCIVIPNRLLAQIVGRPAMKDIVAAFDSSDRFYLYTCEIDYAVYSADGQLIFAEEVQRGGHHDNPEWIRKDALKRAALGLAGIELKESF